MPSADTGLSVIMPCYNVAPWLPRCLESVFVALPSNAEVIAVDDGSTDSTSAVLAGWAETDRRLRVLLSSHGGVSAARNRALDAAVGKYVFFVDPDDAVEVDFFSAMVEALERDGADCCVCGYYEGEDGADAWRTVGLKEDYRFRSNAQVVANYLPRIFGYSLDDVRAWYRGTPLGAKREMAYSWRMAFRRDVIESAHVRFDPALELNEDALFNAEFLLAAKSMTSVARPLYRVTCRSAGAVRTIRRDGLRYCRNKLAMLRKRDALDRRANGSLFPLYAGTCVLSALEILSLTVRGRIPRREGGRLLREYLSEPSVQKAFAGFPLSVRHPLLSLSVLLIRWK